MLKLMARLWFREYFKLLASRAGMLSAPWWWWMSFGSTSEAEKLASGPAIGGLIGSFLINAKGWQWALFLYVIVNAAELVAYVLTFEETVWVPDEREQQSTGTPRTGILSKVIPRRVPGSSLALWEFSALLFVSSLQLLLYVL